MAETCINRKALQRLKIGIRAKFHYRNERIRCHRQNVWVDQIPNLLPGPKKKVVSNYNHCAIGDWSIQRNKAIIETSPVTVEIEIAIDVHKVETLTLRPGFLFDAFQISLDRLFSFACHHQKIRQTDERETPIVRPPFKTHDEAPTQPA